MDEQRTSVLISGLPGKMATLFAETALEAGLAVYKDALTGEGQPRIVEIEEEKLTCFLQQSMKIFW